MNSFYSFDIGCPSRLTTLPMTPLSRSLSMLPGSNPLPAEIVESNANSAGDLDLESGLSDQEFDLADRRHRHLLSDSEYESLLQELLNSPPCPLIPAMASFGTIASPGITTQSMQQSYSPLWAPPISAISLNEALPEEPAIFKVNNLRSTWSFVSIGV